MRNAKKKRYLQKFNIKKVIFNFMKSQQIEIMDNEVTGDPRPALEGK